MIIAEKAGYAWMKEHGRMTDGVWTCDVCGHRIFTDIRRRQIQYGFSSDPQLQGNQSVHHYALMMTWPGREG